MDLKTSKLSACQVCGIGKAANHYGAFACIACQSFFLRVIRSGARLKCAVGDGSCAIENNADYRRSCRSCRYQKCLQAGMRPIAVQQSRDSIRKLNEPLTRLPPSVVQANRSMTGTKKQKSAYDKNGSTEHQNQRLTPHSYPENRVVDLLLHVKTSINIDRQFTQQLAQCFEDGLKLHYQVLMNALNAHGQWPFFLNLSIMESQCSIDAGRIVICQNGIQNAQYQKAVRNEILQFEGDRLVASSSVPPSPKGSTGYIEICPGFVAGNLLKFHAYAIVRASRRNANFNSLMLRDQMSLVRSFSPKLVLFDDVRRSTALNDCLLAADEIHVFRPKPKETYTREPILCRMLEELLPAMRKVEPDNVEYALLKSILFWNSDCCNREAKPRVREIRQQFLCALEAYVNEKSPVYVGRLGSLLLLVSIAENLCAMFRVQMQNLARNPDPLVRDMFLCDNI